MNQTIITTVVLLSATGVLSAFVLYLVAKKFEIKTNPKVSEVLAVLPGVNCGGCGYPGCSNFAETCVAAKDLEKLYCPVAGRKGMAEVAKVLGLEVIVKEEMIAVVRCDGSYENRPRMNIYDGTTSCKIVHNLYTGETGCSYGCLGMGDCVKACRFNAMEMFGLTGLPVVFEKNCVACGACVKACPRQLIELRFKGRGSQRIFVSCSNSEKGGVARKHCKAACIGCGKCVKVCAFGAIEMRSALAYIDFKKCTLCRKCAAECPTGAIHEINFPLNAPREETLAAPGMTKEIK